MVIVRFSILPGVARAHESALARSLASFKSARKVFLVIKAKSKGENFYQKHAQKMDDLLGHNVEIFFHLGYICKMKTFQTQQLATMTHKILFRLKYICSLVIFLHI